MLDHGMHKSISNSDTSPVVLRRKMKAFLLATTLAAASAFMAPVSAPRSSVLNVNELEIGVTEPLGLFDPLNQQVLAPEKFERRRAVERKHGRIAMVAVVGMLVHNAGIELVSLFRVLRKLLSLLMP